MSPLRDALRHPTIRRFAAGSFISNVGTWIQRIAIGWLVFELTGSAAWVGGIAACEVIPSVVIAPFGGVLIDRSDRAWLFAICQIAAQLQAILLAACALLGVLTLEVIIFTSVALGVIDGFSQPIRLAIVTDVAPRGLIRPAVTLNSLGFNTARLVGPAIGGVGLVFGGPGVAFALNALSFMPLTIFTLGMRRLHLLPRNFGDLGLRAGIYGGLRYTISHPVLAPVFFLLITVSLLARPFLELMPAISGLWFDASPGRLATLTSAVGIGSIAGGIWILRRPELKDVLLAVIILPGLLTAVVFLFAAIGRFQWFGYPLLVLAGFCIVAAGVGMQSLIHLSVDLDFHGRVLSLYGLIQRALPALGAILLGLATDLVGLQLPLLLASATAGMLWFVIWRRRFLLIAGLPGSISHLEAS